jgi:hypothetical protein
VEQVVLGRASSNYKSVMDRCAGLHNGAAQKQALPWIKIQPRHLTAAD